MKREILLGLALTFWEVVRAPWKSNWSRMVVPVFANPEDDEYSERPVRRALLIIEETSSAMMDFSGSTSISSARIMESRSS